MLYVDINLIAGIYCSTFKGVIIGDIAAAMDIYGLNIEMERYDRELLNNPYTSFEPYIPPYVIAIMDDAIARAREDGIL